MRSPKQPLLSSDISVLASIYPFPDTYDIIIREPWVIVIHRDKKYISLIFSKICSPSIFSQQRRMECKVCARYMSQVLRVQQ